MAGVFNNTWIPFQDQVGRQGWYNQATGQTTYQMGGMYGGYSGSPMVAPVQQMPMYQPQMPAVPMGYMPQMPQQAQGSMVGWQTGFDRTGRRYYYNPATGQSMYC